MQSAPQLVPVGLNVKFPLPVPVLSAVKLNVSNVNVAVVDLAAFIKMTHGPVPADAHPAPFQPVNVELAPGTAVNVTDVPAT